MMTWKNKLVWAYAMVFPIFFVGLIVTFVALVSYELLTNFEAYIPGFWFVLYWLAVAFIGGSLFMFLQLTGGGKP